MPLLGLAVAVALAYVQPEKLTKTLSLELAARDEQSHEKVAVVVLVVPLTGGERVGKEVMVGVELTTEPVPELERDEDGGLLLEAGKGWFLVVRVVGAAEEDDGASIVDVSGVRGCRS